MCKAHVHVLLSIVITFLFAFTSAQDLKEWSKEDDVKWTDFRATPDDNSKHAASINTGIKYSWKTRIIDGKKTLSYNIIAYMIPSKSWVKSSRKSDYILKHEQLHFDITEYYARQLKEAFADYKIKQSIKTDLQGIYKGIMEERFRMQNRYDRATNHSIDTTAQRQWQEKTEELLTTP